MSTQSAPSINATLASANSLIMARSGANSCEPYQERKAAALGNSKISRVRGFHCPKTISGLSLADNILPPNFARVAKKGSTNFECWASSRHLTSTTRYAGPLIQLRKGLAVSKRSLDHCLSFGLASATDGMTGSIAARGRLTFRVWKSLSAPGSGHFRSRFEKRSSRSCHRPRGSHINLAPAPFARGRALASLGEDNGDTAALVARIAPRAACALSASR